MKEVKAVIFDLDNTILDRTRTFGISRRPLSGPGSAIWRRWKVSEEAGVKKPDPRIFGMAVERLKVRPDECVYWIPVKIVAL